jgi:hypothetical protein
MTTGNALQCMRLEIGTAFVAHVRLTCTARAGQRMHVHHVDYNDTYAGKFVHGVCLTDMNSSDKKPGARCLEAGCSF